MNSEFSRKAKMTPVAQTLNQAPESVLLLDSAGMIELANGPALALFDRDETGLFGCRITSLFGADAAAGIDVAIARVVADEPGNRLEEVRSVVPAGKVLPINLSFARMRNRDGICVVATPAVAAVSPARPRMPRVDDAPVTPAPAKAPEDAVPDAVSRHPARPVPTEPSAPSPPQAASPLAGSMPWNNHARRAAAKSSRQEDRQEAEIDEAPRTPTPAAEAFIAPGVSAVAARTETAKPVVTSQPQNSDSANMNSVKPGTVEARPRISFDPARRDIYAEFQSARESKERHQDLPQISPAKCLISAIQRYRDEALAESLLLATEVEDTGLLVDLDEDMLTLMFVKLVKRTIAVTPPYCEARITLAPMGAGGFVARFADIGRGLGEQELESVFRQPELALGISHTGLVEAQQAAAALGLGFAIDTAISAGTTVEITFEG